MIDIHSHILPGFDDGAVDLSESLNMARAAVNEGIHTIVATPHHQNGYYFNPKNDIEYHILVLNNKLQEANIPLTVLPGQEIRINLNIINELLSGIIVPINNTKYLFIELPSWEVPLFTEQVIYEIQLNGYIPIIVHPERNRKLAEDPSILYNLVNKGALTQITASSLTGNFGKPIQKFAHQLIEHHLTHFIASDAHNMTNRGFHMQKAFNIIKKTYGTEIYYMYLENSKLLIDGQYVFRSEPQKILKKKRIRRFF